MFTALIPVTIKELDRRFPSQPLKLPHVKSTHLAATLTI